MSWRRNSTAGLRRLALVLASFTLLIVCARVAVAAKAPRFWSGQVAVEQAYNDNVQQENGGLQSGDFITSVSGQLAFNEPKRKPLPYRLGMGILGRIYADLPDYSYVEINPEAEVELLPRTDGVIGYWYSPRRLLFEEESNGDNVLYAEHGVSAALQHKLGARKQLRLELGFEGVWDDYRSKDDDRDSFTPALLAEVRYRLTPAALGFTVTPRFGFEHQWRNAHRDNYDREVAILQPGIDVDLPRGLMLRFRFERYFRDYSVDAAKEDGGRRNNNFDRHDDIEQYQTWLTAPLPLVERLTAGLRYRFRRGAYDEPNHKTPDGTIGVHHDFDVHEVGVELAYAFGGAGKVAAIAPPPRHDSGDNK